MESSYKEIVEELRNILKVGETGSIIMTAQHIMALQAAESGLTRIDAISSTQLDNIRRIAKLERDLRALTARPNPDWGDIYRRSLGGLTRRNPAIQLLEQAARDADERACWEDRRVEFGPALKAKATCYREAIARLIR